MLSPFMYEEPIDPGDLVDREEELSTLVTRAIDGRNSRLEGPRRFGKTSLSGAVLTQCRAQGCVTVYVNFLGVLTVADVTERIERAYSQQLDGALKRWLDGLIRIWKPNFKAAPGGVGVGVAPQPNSMALLDRLALPVKMNSRYGKRCVIAFDEFQDVIRIPGVAATFRSELEQQGKAAAYIFSGSHPGLMQDMFADRRHAFFSQASPVPLLPLPADALVDFISNRFSEGRRDPGEALGPLLDLTTGHPQRTMQAAHHLYVHTKPNQAATASDWGEVLKHIFTEASSEIYMQWENLTDIEQRVMSVIAARSVKLNGARAQQDFGLTKGGQNADAVDHLTRDGHILKAQDTATGWQVVDPLMDIWLRNGREWPE